MIGEEVEKAFENFQCLKYIKLIIWKYYMGCNETGQTMIMKLKLGPVAPIVYQYKQRLLLIDNIGPIVIFIYVLPLQIYHYHKE